MTLTGIPPAYLLTFRTYGTWLPGDARGTVTRWANTPGTPLLGDDARFRTASSLLRRQPVVLSDADRLNVDFAIHEACDRYGWALLAANVRTNHVHVVAGNAAKPERMMTVFKAWATHRLRMAGTPLSRGTVWARHGSTRYLWDDAAVEAACEYVLNAQDGDRFSE